jgi:hypothetical protein
MRAALAARWATSRSASSEQRPLPCVRRRNLQRRGDAPPKQTADAGARLPRAGPGPFLAAAVLARGSRQARISRTTRPRTSVSRKSRPA